MSLRPDDRASRARSKSPGGRDKDRDRDRDRDRSRSRSNVRESKKTSSKSSRAEVVDAPTSTVRMPAYPPDEYDTKISTSAVYESRAGGVPYPQDDDDYYTSKDYDSKSRRDYPPPPSAKFPTWPEEDGLAYGGGSLTSSPTASRQNSYVRDPPPAPPPGPYASQASRAATYPYPDEPRQAQSRSSSYSHKYQQPQDREAFTPKPATASTKLARFAQHPVDEQTSRIYKRNTNDDIRTVEVTPGLTTRDSIARSASSRLSVDARNVSGGPPRPVSPGLSSGMSRLSVAANLPSLGGDGGSAGLPPPSPLLEAYRGTYQQISPRPLAIRPLDDEDDLTDLEPLTPNPISTTTGNDKLRQDAERVKTKEKKRVTLYDPETDATTLSNALTRRQIDTHTITQTLAPLTHDQIWYLRKQYKKQVKVSNHGVNLPKHLKTKLPASNYSKAVYVTALGRWESEGYWANFWYQSHSSRRELLIESLMGRSNADIWNIKDEFRDKRYGDSLVTCMETELKMDKFRTAVLMVLEERRQEEQDVYPPEYRSRDVDTLHQALTAPRGGESTMLEIIVRRSDAHLREVLKLYERAHAENFPRAALKKSNNLVGEVIAHILNGAINRPARDALLLRHAIADVGGKNRREELRYELLISRLVRCHWDRGLLAKVMREYRERFGVELGEDVRAATGGDLGEFLVGLL